MASSKFKIYDASAGSGKTFSLVKEYLKVLFSSAEKEPYRHILAITFTNKAVGEMKKRIIENLTEFACESIIKNPTPMFGMLSSELGITSETLNRKAKILLKKILHNYSAFEISTIDKFTQRLIRNFAFDLKLPLNFEVELDTELLLAEAVDNLIARAGSDNLITNILIDFAIEKANDDRSWNIAYDFNETAQLLTNENHLNHVLKIADKSTDSFLNLKQTLSKRIIQVEKGLVSLAVSTLEVITDQELEFSNFTGSYLPKYFQKLAAKNFDVSFTSKWQKDLENVRLYPKTKTPDDIARRIEGIQPELAKSFELTKKLVFQFKFLTNFYKNITPLSVLNAINKELQLIKEDRNLLLISEFNSIVSTHLKDQPAPFIYERIGEKFKHYFIDEFQDTSVMQWENLIPLINNALSGEKASAMLVGDAKQAIYRWRGGRAEQFIALSSGASPFNLIPEKLKLNDNYRSAKRIVQFNNDFFQFLNSIILENRDYDALYSDAFQTIKNEDIEGFVDISILNTGKDNRDNLYSSKVHEKIKSCIKNGFALRDICVLTRKKKEGIALAEYLTHEGVPIISSETLLIASSPRVQFIMNLLKLLIEPKNDLLKLEILMFLAEHKIKVQDLHEFYSQRIHLSIEKFFRSLEQYDIFFKPSELLSFPLYEMIDVMINDFQIHDSTDAHIQFFQDFVLQYSQKKVVNIYDFLEHFEKQKERLSVASSDLADAVKIMTIHKSKGLEFPVVIFPFANLDIYRKEKPKAWLPISPEEFLGFDSAFINLNKDVENYNEQGQELFRTNKEELELDNINLLYVVLTRAIEQLYIISELETQKTNTTKVNINKYSGLLISFLQYKELWNDFVLNYSFGNKTRETKQQPLRQHTNKFSSYSKMSIRNFNPTISTKSGYLWDTKQKSAIEKGNLVHLVMSKIYTEKDVGFAISDLLLSNQLQPSQIDEIRSLVESIINHELLKPYFKNQTIIYNEHDIITDKGEIIRPDRLVVMPNKKGVLIDYKTGGFQEKHYHQIKKYAYEIGKMGISIYKSILVYINADVKVKEL